MRRILLVVFSMSALPTAAAGGDTPTAEVRKIWDRAPHNAFTDLVHFRGRFWCTFREGDGHAKGAGVVRVLASADGEKWEPAGLLEEPGVDLRDPKLSVTPDGRLMIVGGAFAPASRDPVRENWSFASFLEDGRDWGKIHRVLGDRQWLWRVVWHNRTAYGVAYGWDRHDGKNENYRAALYRSGDGLRFEKVTDFDAPGATEGSLAFDGEVLYCLQRRDGRLNTAWLGRSEPPYTQWTWKDLGASFGGPNLIRLPDGSWWAAGRKTEGGKPQTVLCRLDVKEGKLDPALILPSGGDTSYPGLVWHNDQLWVSYYSTHEGKTGIYLARVKLGAF